MVKVRKLNLKQERFCQLFATQEEFFGNGVASYLKAYNPKREKVNWYKIACTDASRLLSNAKVCARIAELLTTDGFNDENVMKQHLFLINQMDDKSAKNKAIESFYKLKGKILDRAEVTLKGGITLTSILEAADQPNGGTTK